MAKDILWEDKKRGIMEAASYDPRTHHPNGDRIQDGPCPPVENCCSPTRRMTCSELINSRIDEYERRAYDLRMLLGQLPPQMTSEADRALFDILIKSFG